MIPGHAVPAATATRLPKGGVDEPMDETTHLFAVQRELNQTVRELGQTVQNLALSVNTLRAEMPTRLDIQREVDKRLPTENFTLAHTALVDEVKKNQHEFEQYVMRAQNSWQRAAPWISMFVGGGVGCLSLLVTLGIAGVSAVFYLAQHLH